MRRKLMMMLALLLIVVGAKATSTAQAVWVEGNKTLYFIYQETVVKKGDTFDTKTVTDVWSGTAVTATGESTPGWRNIRRDVTKVKFDNSFVNVTPTSFDSWFWGFENVTAFDGLSNLKTSEATTMKAMFYACSSMKSINVNTFDMGKVTTVQNMFWGCDNLKTITCDKTWNYDEEHSSSMFWACRNLKGAREYSRETALDYNATMANPVTGYFTMTDGTVMSGEGTADKPIELSKALEWDVVGNYVAAGKDCSSLHFQMLDKFTVTTVIGTSAHPFNGTFDGNTKLLTANIDGGTNIHTAPFAHIAGATIKGVTVDGTIKGGRHTAGLVGNVVSGTNMVTDCYVVKGTTITTSDSHAGGIIGHGQSATLTVSGCVFEGTVKKETAAALYVGAIVGWCDTYSGITVSDCFELGTYTNFTNKGMNYKWTTGSSGETFSGSRCYSTNGLGGATQVYEIDGAEDLAILTPIRQAYPTTLTFYGDNNQNGGLCFRQIDEIYEGMIWDIDYEYYAAAGDVVKFTAETSNITVKDADNNNVAVSGSNTDADPLQFTMPAKKVTMTANEITYAYAIWCSGNATLYFDYTKDDIKAGNTYKEQTVTSVWKGNDVLAVGWGTPKWNSIANSVTTVVFDAKFADARPTSLYWWFCNMSNLTSITDLRYLNTSEVTNMNSTFYGCRALRTLDLDNFDMGKVTNATSMFRNCQSLTTIYCSKSWNIGTSENMFSHCFNLVGAVRYSEDEPDGDMANPTKGYFTQPDTKVYALWCSGNATLYFITSESAIHQGDTYNGQTITYLWNGNDVIKTGSEHPQWLNDGLNVQPLHVVFDASFTTVKPTSLYEWFKNFANLEDVTGLDYLKTNEVTTTVRMFGNCVKLTTLDLSSFDMSKVTDMTDMFHGCVLLATIKCNDTWTPASSSDMFSGCTSLKGAADFDAGKITAAMANPYTGYFTATKNVFELASTEDWDQLAAYVNAGNSCKNMRFTMTKDFKAGKMIGTDDHHFRGTFDGAGYTLEVEYGSEETPFNQDRCAPFRYIGYGARIENLIVTGDIYTSAKGGAGVVSQTYNEATLSNILCTVNIHSSFDSSTIQPYDPASHGGLIGNVNGDEKGTKGTTIVGCSFQGSLLGEKSDGVGGFVGIKGSKPYLTIYDSFFAPKEVTMSGSYSNTFSRYANTEPGDGALTIGDICYYTTTLGTAQGQKAQVIKDESESCYIKNISDYYNVSMIITHTNGTTTKTSMMAFVVDEIDDGDIEGEYQWLAASGGNVYFESTAIDLAAKDADGATVELTEDSSHNYHFTMPAKDVTITGAGSLAYAIWCNGNKTLYFDYSDTKVNMGESYTGKYDDQTVTQVWSGNDVVNIGWSIPKWSDFAYSATTVVFTEAFKDVKPTSMNRWFWNFKALTSFTGLANLNTSEVTVMNSTFYDCDALTRIDVNSFSVGKVTNASSMFGNCDNLETIFCNDTWPIATTQKMFYNSRKLKSPNATYSDDHIDGAMANPNTGYFTKKELTLANAADNSNEIEKFEGIEDVKVILTGRTLYRDGNWNTICLPFDVTIDGSVLDKNGVDVKELDVNGTYETNKKTGFEESTGTLYLYFKNEDTKLKAGTPYIIKWNDVENDDIINPVFIGVTVSSKTAGSVTSEDTKVSFVGTYGYQSFTAADHTILFVGAEDKLYWPENGANIGAQRAYFQLNGITVGDVTGGAHMFFLDDSTGLSEKVIVNSENFGTATSWYTLDGRKLDGKPTTKGVYIYNGRKVVM
jgi:surface protein